MKYRLWILATTCLTLATGQNCAAIESGAGLQPVWIESSVEGRDGADAYTAFRGRFTLPEASEVEFRILGASWFNAWLDGEFVLEGPARFHKAYPEYDSLRVRLEAGEHLLAVQVHDIGVTTRILVDMPPFLACEILSAGKALPVEWRCLRLPGYHSSVRRINPQLGWIEWCDTRLLPAGWKSLDFNDGDWTPPVAQDPGIGAPRPLSIESVQFFTHAVKPIAQGPLAETFGYERDDIPVRFFLRDLVCDDLPPQGLWRRYDLGRVRLARPRFVLDLPEGAVVEFAYSESLTRGRVSPYINLSAGPSCNMDHYVARGGVQEFFPLTPKGGRFVEIHIFAGPGKVRFIREEFIERCYHGVPAGAFHCDDALLGRIWETGIETYLGCAEDAVIDNPTRERGQWTGDVVTVAMDIAASGYSDLRLCRRALQQSAYCAREDGLIAGLCPGGPAYMPTYAAQWTSACVHYWELTGDRKFLEEMLPYAEHNMAAYDRFVTPDGLTDGLGWTFVDWGYKRPGGPVDMAYNLHFLAAVRDMMRWCVELERGDRLSHYKTIEETIAGAISKWFNETIAENGSGWEEVGYHCAVLGLKLGFFEDQMEQDCTAYIKRHISQCFPNNSNAPRNSDPSVRESMLITPYFAHYAFPTLIERGEMDFVLDQYRKCWGWALEQGRTTWIEVFDTRWSHCHQWAGCPTWQLSRYVLGLRPRFDLGERHYDLTLETGSLQQAEGRLPLPGREETIDIQWTKTSGEIHYHLETSAPVYLHIKNPDMKQDGECLRIERECSLVIPSRN